MPSVPTVQICNFFGCKNTKAFGTGYCHKHGAKRSDSYEENAKLYNSVAWRKKRTAMRTKYPICSACLLDGRVTQTEHIDHVIPHRRIPDRFLTNLFQGLCAPHHSTKTNLESQGIFRHYTENGIVDYNENDYNLLMLEKFHTEGSHWASPENEFSPEK
jgi:5-methylcytosine-specific restriction protein A